MILKFSIVLWVGSLLFLSNSLNCFAGAVPVSGSVMVIDVKLVDSKPKIQKIVLKPGNVNDRAMKVPSGNISAFHLTVIDHGGTSLYEMDFFFPITKTIPPGPPGEIMDQLPSNIRIDNPEITLIVPYFEDADTILMMNPGNPYPVETKDLSDVKAMTTKKNSYVLQPAPAEPGKMNFLIIASGYNSESFDAFQNQADKIKTAILSTEPFRSRSSNINIHIYANTKNLGCYTGCSGIDRLMCCDDLQVVSAASTSGFFFDEIIVVHNTSIYSGAGYREDLDAYKTNSYNSFCTVYDGEYSALMAVHELGHSFGNLCDEYSKIRDYTTPSCVNCMASCNQYPATTICQSGCETNPDYYRPDNSIMESLSYTHFNNASILAEYSPDGLKKRLNFFIQAGDIEIYRFFNTKTGTHFYTASFNEMNFIAHTLPHYNYEGVAFFGASDTSAVDVSPVYRFYNSSTGTHFYTISKTEKDYILSNFPNFSFEGEAYSAHTTNTAGTKALHRFYNTKTGTHFYTTNDTEKTNVQNTLPQYNYEGIAYYVE